MHLYTYMYIYMYSIPKYIHKCRDMYIYLCEDASQDTCLSENRKPCARSIQPNGTLYLYICVYMYMYNIYIHIEYSTVCPSVGWMVENTLSPPRERHTHTLSVPTILSHSLSSPLIHPPFKPLPGSLLLLCVHSKAQYSLCIGYIILYVKGARERVKYEGRRENGA